MKHLYRITVWPVTLAVTFAVIVLAGCTSERRKEANLARMGDETPPDFLVGPAAMALTNLDGFSANVVSTASAEAQSRTVTGQLLERQGRLIFQPMTTANIKKGKFVHGGMIFIWDTEGLRGNVVSEALQGYAPLAAPVRITSVTPMTTEPVAESVNGHPCHRLEMMVALADGSTAKLTEWRADDLNHVPVRVRTENGGHIVTVDLSEIRLDPPAPELFVPPGVFTAYASPMALINELMIRESSLKTGPSGEAAPLPGQPANWHQPAAGARY